MSYENILCTIDAGVATVVVNRPKVLNALNSATIAELTDAFDKLAADAAVRGVILTGAGDKAFVAGADIGELATKNPQTGRQFALTGQSLFNKIERLSKPVIAAVNGFALGGGCELSTACHMRVAAHHAKFGQPEVGLGIIPGYGGTQRLPRLVGKGRALELLLGGGMIDAAEAYRIGLVNCVVEAYKKDSKGALLHDDKGRKIFDPDYFQAEVKRMLRGFLAKGPVALACVLDAVNRGLDVNLEEGLRIEADLFGLVYASDDCKEGLTAFLEKREPKFQGK